ncbi:amino acid ABC transporter permease [Camelimonas lactis]|uniref:Polar amino acid transport system permease protein n=1 Tax=Camelimonas lactis TaxID=659006 RepID=A0A4R2GPC4_9HYPH|nr:amino acid ABC transporter permease [Camelimonas lactis]TCO11191.1 polar amino acid transport system permease protein [Camelimonas lactis]
MASFLALMLEYWPQVLSGLGNTLLLAAVISVTGLAGGVVVFYLAISGGPLRRRLTEGYISFFIGTPLIVLLFLMYYGLPQWGLKLTPFTVAVIGFTLNVAAYNARYLMTAFRGLDPDELQAARAQGFSDLQVFQLVILPQVMRLSVPALTNQVILNLKDSSIAFLIQYAEFFAQMQDLAIRSFRFLDAYLVAGAVYLALVSVVVVAARWLERRYVLPGVRRAR